MEGLYKVVGIRHTLLNRIADSVIIAHGLCDDGHPCLLWNGDDTRVRFDGKRFQCARFVYHHLVAPLSASDRVVQTCRNKDGMTCIQPKHLAAMSFDKESEDWRSRKRANSERRNARKRLRRAGLLSQSETTFEKIAKEDEMKEEMPEEIEEDPEESSSDIQTPLSSPMRTP